LNLKENGAFGGIKVKKNQVLLSGGEKKGNLLKKIFLMRNKIWVTKY
jgi:hypothetical protein